jgi:hypothetical protein
MNQKSSTPKSPYNKKKTKAALTINGMKVTKSQISYKNPNGGGINVRLTTDTDPLDILLPVKKEPEPPTVSDQ